MDKSVRPFPLVADGQPVTTEETLMSLYNNEDLISNIHGAYQEKSYDDIRDIKQAIEPSVRRVQQHQRDIDSGKSYAQRARQQAKVDVKQKRQTYLTKDIRKTTGFESPKKSASKPQASKKRKGDYAKFSERLHQESYILAELPKQYKEPNNKPNTKAKKNNYDFLKTSQIYNPEQRQAHHERAQELNLSRFQ